MCIMHAIYLAVRYVPVGTRIKPNTTDSKAESVVFLCICLKVFIVIDFWRNL